MSGFKLVSEFAPTGDQPQAIEKLVKAFRSGKKAQTLLGVTGSGKTFTMANIIAQMNRPTLVFSHNKTLAGQLYSEFKELFPHNRVEFFVSNFDYYQPEAYMPKSDMYIEKTAAINEELDMFRESTLNSLLERRDTIVVASVACIYAASDPVEYKNMFYTIRVGESIDRNDLMRRLIELQYSRNDVDQTRGTIRVRGDIIDLTPSYTNEFNIRIEMFGEEIERITEIDPLTGKTMNAYQFYNIFPASGYARSKETMLRACDAIEAELEDRLEYFRQKGKPLEAERLEQRTRFDLEALRENGYCSGIENYSMHIDGRKIGQRPWNLFIGHFNPLREIGFQNHEQRNQHQGQQHQHHRQAVLHPAGEVQIERFGGNRVGRRADHGAQAADTGAIGDAEEDENKGIAVFFLIKMARQTHGQR